MSVHLHIEVQDNSWLHILSVPLADIRGLCHRPLKWLRFVSFAICGARGDISMTEGGDTVDYENTLAAEFQAGHYYYNAQGPRHFVDPEVIENRHSSVYTLCRQDFRTRIAQRDRHQCLFSPVPWNYCEAAHVIPHCKGHNYIAALVTGRGSLYGVKNDVLEEHGINSVQNGLLMNKILHSAFEQNHCALLKTPNFALRTDDIPYLDGPDGSAPDARCTLQFVHNALSFPEHNRDARPSGPEDDQLWSLFTDLTYGAVVFQKWFAGDAIRAWFRSKAAEGILATVAAMPPAQVLHDDELGQDSGPEEDDPNDPDWTPGTHVLKAAHRRSAEEEGAARLSQALDVIFMIQCFMRGTTIEAELKKVQDVEERAEQRRKAESRAKAAAWCNAQAAYE
ncbi:hypothetical protein BOTBODRAFT_269539 [Botryobasidium botryosum FD-172 SS1]|uniref:HNH nuclease domain-containing protein n=1 Tax=Botryobasidium botryosum (strain FD-172 SS1) TaxID=930990 RepID=A0A067MKR3_BOTB1|nr:hypothetical protein BOTBODRAFT_269539 [Botryobasidium botryosum FD-172 SS1]